MMLKESDIERIDRLKDRLDASTKVEVVRTALDLLERDTDRAERVARWKKVASRVAKTSRKTLQEFRGHSRLKRGS